MRKTVLSLFSVAALSLSLVGVDMSSGEPPGHTVTLASVEMNEYSQDYAAPVAAIYITAVDTTAEPAIIAAHDRMPVNSSVYALTGSALRSVASVKRPYRPPIRA